MESIYYVMAWACHRRCKHCYEDRFRPYMRQAFDGVVAQAVRNFPRIVDHFPERMTYIDLAEGPGQHTEKVGRIILSGGEALLDGVREAVTYPVIERLQASYRAAGDNSLPRGSIAENFCNRWSGGLNFLRHRYSGSEVSVEPDGSVYPCCVKTALPLGNLTEEPLLEILDSLVGVPAFEAITMGHPERMGLAHGWDETRFIEASRTTLPDGRPCENLCIGCDRFHQEHLGPVLAAARARRLAARQGAAAAPADRHPA